jgi:ABC-type Fe3+/spermidine/putrescine transport system ATPase subunit
VRKRFGTHEALMGVDLEVRPGEFFTLVGPSGCGKTTLLRCVAGFCRPDGGEIVCDGQRLDPLPPHRRNLGMVFQNYALFPHLSVRENVAYGLRARKVPSPVVAERLERALEQVHLAHRAGDFPGMLSGGEQQRVATARALAIEPRLLLMDEPLSNLDAKLRVEMRAEIRRVQRSLGITTLYVTHDQEEALALSDRIAVMNAGRLEQIGDPLEIYRYPATPFVAGFIGHTNFLAGEVVSVAGGQAQVRLKSAPGPQPMERTPDVAQPPIRATLNGRPQGVPEGPPPAVSPAAGIVIIGVAARDLAPGQAVTLALRPERFSLAAPGMPNTMAGVVEDITFLGAVTRLRVQTAAGPITVELHAEGAEGLKPGAQVSLSFDSEAATVFPQPG